MTRFIYFVGFLFAGLLSSTWAQEPSMQKVDLGFELADGAAWDGHRTLLVPDVKGGVLWSIPTEQDIRKARKRLDGDWAISGTCYQNGKLYFVDGKQRKLFQLPDSGAPKELACSH